MKLRMLSISAIVILSLTACGGSSGDDSGSSASTPWIGSWTQVNFLTADDGGVWNSDSLEGLGFIAEITSEQWKEKESGCEVIFSYSVSSALSYSKQGQSKSGNCPALLNPGVLQETGRLEFSNNNAFMIQYFDNEEEILAFKWMRISANPNNNTAVGTQDFEDGLLTGWSVGGRQITGSGNTSGVQNYASSKMAYLTHTSFTELTLSKSFDFSADSYLSFDAEFSINGNTSLRPNGSSNFYSMVYYGVDFYDALGVSLGNINYATATTNFPFSNGSELFAPNGLEHYEHDIPLLAATLGLDIENISTFSLRFGGYSSWWSNQNMTIRFDNVKGD